jgi:hypothetical protein
MTAAYLDTQPHLLEKWSNLNPMGRIGRPDELRGVIAWLASDASSFCTGSEYAVFNDDPADEWLMSFKLQHSRQRRSSFVVIAVPSNGHCRLYPCYIVYCSEYQAELNHPLLGTRYIHT